MLLSSIRQHILDRAIRGQLVPQLPEEGSAEELYQQIQAEKKALIANGTIKKEKPLESIQEEDIPFEIPATWKWVRLGDCFDVCTGKTPSKSETKNYEPAQVAFFKPADIQNGSHISSCAEQVSELGALEAPNFPSGSILVNCIGHIGKCAITDIGGICNQQINAILPRRVCNMQFVLYVMQSTDVLQQENRLATATTISILNKNNFRTIIIPLPPLPEQNRIVRKTESLFTALGAIESSKKHISAIQTELTKRILEQAIQGKLVPQLPEEGTAEELYQQIQAEKQRLIAEGTIKREKALSPIKEDEIPFDIPETWKWVRLPSITYPVGNKDNQIQAKEVLPEGLFPAVSQGATLIEGFSNEKSKVIHDLPLLMFGDHTRNVKHIDFPFVICADGTKFMKPVGVHPLYLYYWMTSSARQLKNRGYARHFALLNATPVPLPPLEEQKRIVAKIEEMLHLNNQL